MGRRAARSLSPRIRERVPAAAAVGGRARLSRCTSRPFWVAAGRRLHDALHNVSSCSQWGGRAAPTPGMRPAAVGCTECRRGLPACLSATRDSAAMLRDARRSARGVAASSQFPRHGVTDCERRGRCCGSGRADCERCGRCCGSGRAS